MKYSVPYVIRTIVIVIVLLAMFHFLTPSNPIVELADDIVCDFTDDEICADIKKIENEI